MNTWEETKQKRKQNHIFGTNFGYEGEKLTHAISMYSLGFENGFDDLKNNTERLEEEIEKLKKSLIEIRDYEHDDHLDVIGRELKEIAKNVLTNGSESTVHISPAGDTLDKFLEDEGILDEVEKSVINKMKQQ